MWRYWQVHPPRGRMGIFLGSWYTAPIIDRVFGRIEDDRFEQSLDQIIDFERMLSRENTLVVKFWMHISKKVQKKRLEELAADPERSWRVTKRDWKFFRKYDKFSRFSEAALARTNTGEAPWHIIEAADPRHRTIAATTTLLETIEGGLARVAAAKSAKSAKARPPEMPKPLEVNILRQLDLGRKLEEEPYEKSLTRLMGDVARLTCRLREKQRGMILVFEGSDAAGKGGTIRRLVSAMDARNYRVIAVAAPTDEERSHPYLWRFWRHLPRLGRVTIYDRSWYGRVLVERVEGFCPQPDWTRAYAEINDFERNLTDFGIIVLKFWLAISPEEQLRRFHEREHIAYKQYKITGEDWRNRKKWGAYEAAACDMIEKTSRSATPWTLVESEDKNWARIKVMKTTVRALEKALG